MNFSFNFSDFTLGSLPIELISIFPELFLFLAISVLLLVGASYSTSKYHGYPMLVKPVAWLTMFSLFLAFLLVVNNPYSYNVIFSGALIVDNFSNFVKGVILLSSIACLAVSLDYMKNERIHAFEYSILILFAIVGMLLLVSSYDLITLYLAIEMVSLSSYVLATFKRQSAFSTEAGLKYFVFGGLMSCFLLFGICLVYLFFGSVSFELIFSIASYNNEQFLFIGFLFILFVLLFKVGCAPFHF
jgi:NADH-quinone oxidoreductase subunit N